MVAVGPLLSLSCHAGAGAGHQCHTGLVGHHCCVEIPCPYSTTFFLLSVWTH